MSMSLPKLFNVFSLSFCFSSGGQAVAWRRGTKEKKSTTAFENFQDEEIEEIPWPHDALPATISSNSLPTLQCLQNVNVWSQTYQSLTIEDLADFPIWYGKYMTKNAWSKGSKAFLIAMHQRHVGSVSSRWMSTAASKAMQPNGLYNLKDLCQCGPCLLAIAGCCWSF